MDLYILVVSDVSLSQIQIYKLFFCTFRILFLYHLKIDTEIMPHIKSVFVRHLQ